jgi:histidine triad (HIT) family protein
MSDCLFCRLIADQIPSHKIYEDERHIAVLDIFPSVRGQALVLPKKHLSSYVFALDDADYSALMRASREVALLIDRTLGTIRTCMVMEGMEVDHAHIKLYPIHAILRHTATETIDLNQYPGYLSTLHGERMPDAELAEIAAAFRADT